MFYLLRQKELRQLKAGIFKVMNTKKGGPMSAAQFMAQVDNSSEHLESNLCNMLRSLRSTNQYWYLRRSELKCMIAEYGSPIFFLTFSCAEYYSADIKEYLLISHHLTTLGDCALKIPYLLLHSFPLNSTSSLIKSLSMEEFWDK